MSLTEKVIVNDFNVLLFFSFFYILNPCFLFLPQFPVLMVFFEVMHELSGVFLSIGVLAACVSPILTTVVSSEATAVAAWVILR